MKSFREACRVRLQVLAHNNGQISFFFATATLKFAVNDPGLGIISKIAGIYVDLSKSSGWVDHDLSAKKFQALHKLNKKLSTNRWSYVKIDTFNARKKACSLGVP